jgi:hypothetical protein
MVHRIVTALLLTALHLACTPAAADGKNAATANAAPGKESGAARFDKELRKRACELLTPKMVASTFGVPEAEIKQIKMGGCRYSWKSDDQILEAAITSISVQRSAAESSTRFKNATKGMSPAEVSAAMAGINAEASKSGKLDTAAKQDAAAAMGAGMMGEVGGGGIQFRDVAGVGDEARVNINDGTVWFRVDNMMAAVEAYHGPKMPRSTSTGDPVGMLAAIQGQAAAWQKSTLPKREQQSLALAKVVVKAL